MRVPPLKVIVKTIYGTQVRVWLYVQDHGQDLQFYSLDKKTKLVDAVIVVWDLGHKYKGNFK